MTALPQDPEKKVKEVEDNEDSEKRIRLLHQQMRHHQPRLTNQKAVANIRHRSTGKLIIALRLLLLVHSLFSLTVHRHNSLSGLRHSTMYNKHTTDYGKEIS